MAVLVLRHESFEGLGYFTDAFLQRGITYFYHDFSPAIVAGKHEAIVILGGPMSANDPLPSLSAELRVIEQALKDGTPMLGVCLGSQLIAKALGARVYRNAELEIGWAPVHFTDAGKADPLFCRMESPTTFFHWHGETFDLPAGAEWLAYSEKCRHQAYRFGGNVYGLQFHPEVTAAMAKDWQEQPVNCGDVATLGDRIDPHAHDQAELAARVIEGWTASF
jgi:GMP synthase (glutamine-hydrolysing)